MGETSLHSPESNSQYILQKLISDVHETQTELVKQGHKQLEDLQYGEEIMNFRNKNNNCFCY